MELLSGTQLAWQQYVALLRKNMILTWRHKRSTFLQLFASLFLLCLSFWVNKAVLVRLSISGENILQPQAVLSPPIPPCEDKFFVKTPCYDFLWSGNSGPRIEAIAHAIMKNNPGRPIPANKVKSFATAEDVNSWLLENPLRCPGVLHFSVKDANIISYGIQTNSTPVARRSAYEDVNFKFKIPLQIAAEREISRSLIGDPNLEWDVGLKQFAYPAKDASPVSDNVDEIGPAVFLAIAMFGFVIQISSLVTEKELKLRQAMSMMGLYESAYWLSWLTWEALLTLISSLLTVLFGVMFQFRFFKNNSFAVLFCLFLLFQLNMTSFAFMVSTFVNKASSATTVGFSIFIIGFLTQIGDKFDFPYSENFKEEYRIMWSFFPPNLFTKAIGMLNKATATSKDAGISWSGRADCSIKEPDCIITIDIIYQWLLATFFMWFILAIYFDNILPNVNGGRKFVLYFLNPHYWTGNGGSKTQEGSIFSCMGSVPAIEEDSQKDEDVLAEETIVKRQTENGDANPDAALEVRGLAKTYPGGIHLSRGFCCCCKCKRTPPYHAVKGIWVNFAKDQLFCLLGPNGAGKTTVINCLTGITPITNGDALIYGNSVRSSVGMANIRRMIGVCPQFDILWDALTATEHLILFASIKGLPPSEINVVAYKSLAEVKLANAANVRAGSYSGGMKRRLSVAIALIGDPKMVFLDEPTTGMDPITRRHVWDIIEHAKKGRAIVLTTHSMEEADILSDRIAIMAKGKLRCIGTSIRLKSRFGAGYIANINFSTVGDGNSHLESVKRFFLDRLNVKPKEENKAFLTFVIPHEKEPLLTNFFAELQDRENEFGISDIQLGLTTLEEVFLNIAKKAELESSIDEGNLVTLHLTSGTSLQVQKGVRNVGIPGTECYKNPRGLMVEVCWEQGEDGTLCISGHSDEMSVPADVELIRNPSLQRKDSIPVGYVIEPSQLNS